MIVLQKVPKLTSAIILFPDNYCTKSFVNYIEAHAGYKLEITPIWSGNSWWGKHCNLITRYGLSKFTDRVVDIELTINYCHLFEEEYCYAENNYIDRQ